LASALLYKPAEPLEERSLGMTFEYLDHTADIAVRLTAPDLKSLLQEATRALRDIFLEAGKGALSAQGQSVSLSLESEDGEALLVDYLNELIFLFDTRRLLAAELEIGRLAEQGPLRLEAVVQGEIYDPARHVLKTEVKAATFHGLKIRQGATGLEAEVVFDL
jgi:SHS2 domain-containing protein